MTETPKIPETLGRYEILDELGKGAMGIVYLGRDPLIGRQLALKTFRLGYSAGDQELEQFRVRFLREAQSAGILSHPNIVTIHDVAVDPSGDFFIAMEYVQGTDLKLVMQRQGRFEPRFAVDVVAQIADGLDYAHSKGVVHRDIKPANIIITADKQAKITDFGIARVEASNLTMEGQLLGTPNYMAPEQIQGKEVDHRADIFSLGVMFYELLSGKKPFAAQNLSAVTHRIVNEPFPPLEEEVPGLPPAITQVLALALAKDSAERYDRGATMAADLRAIYVPASSPSATAAVPATIRSGSFLDGAPAPSANPTGAVATGRATSAPTVATPAAAREPSATDEPARGKMPVAGRVAAAAGLAFAVALGGIGIFKLVASNVEVPEPQHPQQAVPLVEESPALPTDGTDAEESDVAGRLEAAREALRDRDYQTAIRLAEDVLEVEPEQQEGQDLLAEALAGAKRRQEIRDSLRKPPQASPPRPAPSRPAAAPPAAPPQPTAKATLVIDFSSRVSEGRLTIFNGQKTIYKQKISGNRRASLLLPSGDLDLRIYLYRRDAKARNKTRSAEIKGNLAPDSTRVLKIEVSDEGFLSVALE